MSVVLDLTSQAAITFTGATAVWLAMSRKQRTRRWAPVLGLAGQPAWFTTFILNGQWLMLPIALIYTACWMRGAFTHWIRPQPEDDT